MFHVKQDLPLDDLLSFLNTEQIVLNNYQITQLSDYLMEIRARCKTINLISRGDVNLLVQRHFLPSFYYLHYILKDGAIVPTAILDVGSGAGFPGIILSVCLPGNRLVLLDSSRKKSLFLKETIRKLGLSAIAINDRAENLTTKYSDRFNVAVARAVTDIPRLVSWVFPLLNRQGRLFVLKGYDYKSELKNMNTNEIVITEMKPSQAWIEFSPYLEKKIMLKLEPKYA
jgi:16S rRNA (guanine527-N7)-methyltransferase